MRPIKLTNLLVAALVFICFCASRLIAQEVTELNLLTLDRIFNSGEFRQEYQRPIQWINNEKAYVTIEKSVSINGADEPY